MMGTAVRAAAAPAPKARRLGWIGRAVLAPSWLLQRGLEQGRNQSYAARDRLLATLD